MRRMNTHYKQTLFARCFSVFLTVVILVACVAAVLPCMSLTVSAAEGGSCGADLTWSYSAGVLTISGRGEMADYGEPDMVPWYSLRDDISRIVLPEELTSIGSFAFYDCNSLKGIVVPDSVRSIGKFAFASCETLTVLNLGKRLSNIETGAFYGCIALDSVRLPYGLEILGSQAFYRCESLTTVTVPVNVKELGTSVFAYCKNLIRAEIKARLTSLPEWTFYGCEGLRDVILAETVSEVENYAFRNCDGLSTVYFDGSEQKAESIRQGIVESVPTFSNVGYISQTTPSDTVYSGKTVENDDGTVTQSNIKINEAEHIKVVTVVDRTHSVPSVNPDGDIIEPTEKKDSYAANLTVTVEDKQGWDSVQTAVKDALKEINDTYSGSSAHENTQLTFQIKDGGFQSEAILPEIAGREVNVTVVTPSGSEWRFDCEDMKKDEIPNNTNFSYTVSDAAADTCEKLGTDSCYQVKFEESAEMKAEVVIPLPSAEYSNAFLYQIEEDGSHTLLQAVAVDQNANAHFYVASVDANTNYVIGVDVPGESTENIIVPDELVSQYGNKVDRLVKREYVITGVKSSWGLSFMQVTWIMLAVLAVCVVIVGIVMAVLNKRRLQKLYSEA